jgi:hypothetical protein
LFDLGLIKFLESLKLKLKLKLRLGVEGRDSLRGLQCQTIPITKAKLLVCHVTREVQMYQEINKGFCRLEVEFYLLRLAMELTDVGFE